MIMKILHTAMGRGPKRRNSLQVILLWICVMIPVSALLYGTSAAVREKENQLGALHAQISAEQDSLRVLRAEWAYLNQPQKLITRAQKYLIAKKAAAPAQVLAERQIATKVAYRSNGAVYASNMTIQPSAPNTPHLLAKPIVYNDNVLAALHTKDDVKLPSAISWSQKLVSAFGLSNSLASEGQGKSRPIP
jgi:hypothetical protein